MPRTVLRRLTLTDFRSYARAALALDGRPVFLFGPNGAGKTNLLEAISFLIPGRGLRDAAMAEVGRREPGDAQGGPGPWPPRCEGADGPIAGRHRAWRRAGARAAQRADRWRDRRQPGRLAELVRLVWLTPARGPALPGGRSRAAALLRPAGVRRRARATPSQVGGLRAGHARADAAPGRAAGAIRPGSRRWRRGWPRPARAMAARARAHARRAARPRSPPRRAALSPGRPRPLRRVGGRWPPRAPRAARSRPAWAQALAAGAGARRRRRPRAHRAASRRSASSHTRKRAARPRNPRPASKKR